MFFWKVILEFLENRIVVFFVKGSCGLGFRRWGKEVRKF